MCDSARVIGVGFPPCMRSGHFIHRCAKDSVGHLVHECACGRTWPNGGKASDEYERPAVDVSLDS